VEAYPVSSTFPKQLIFTKGDETNIPDDLSTVLPHVEVGAHGCCTYQSAGMLKRIALDAAPLMRRRRVRLQQFYGIEDDIWRDTMESLEQLRDDYDHDKDNDE
jgi:hypothetical protein